MCGIRVSGASGDIIGAACLLGRVARQGRNHARLDVAQLRWRDLNDSISVKRRCKESNIKAGHILTRKECLYKAEKPSTGSIKQCVERANGGKSLSFHKACTISRCRTLAHLQ